jgi:hypothetical protein
MMENVTGCAQDSIFFTTSEGLLVLLTAIQDQVYLLAWDGVQWSDAQLQRELTGFVDPDTFRVIDYGCQRYDYDEGEDRLVSVGCEIGLEGTGVGDAWTISRRVGDVTVWFPPPSVWIAPLTLTSNTGEIQSPILVSDQDNNSHLLWSQSGSGEQSNLNSNINYARWDGKSWTRPLGLFETLSNSAVHPSAALDESGILYVTWNDLQTGELYFSWAESNSAYISNEWATPILLPSYGLVARSPVIYIDSSGTINIAYVVPFNENRGVYLIQSVDGGRTWMDPILVFDAESAGWEMVDQPSITGTLDGKLHVLWIQSTLPDGVGPLNLYYITSIDGGQSWTLPEVVVEGQVEWNQILGFGEQSVHRLWWELSFRVPVIRHQVSYDGGITWSPATSISSFGEASGAPGVAIDSAGQIHLVQMYLEDGNKSILRNWQWDGEQWAAGVNLHLGDSDGVQFLDIAANASPASRLEIVFSSEDLLARDQLLNNDMHYTVRYIGESPTIQVPSNNLTPTPAPSPTLQAIPTPTNAPTEFIPTPTVSLANLGPRPSTSESSYQGLIYGGVIAVIIVAVIFAVFIFRSYRAWRE